MGLVIALQSAPMALTALAILFIIDQDVNNQYNRLSFLTFHKHFKEKPRNERDRHGAKEDNEAFHVRRSSSVWPARLR